MRKFRWLVGVVAVTIWLCQIPTAFAVIRIVAAENFYGDVAKSVGGDRVVVTSVLQNPEQDPHLFTTSPSVAKDVAAADIVVYNGAHYDDWMPTLLSVRSLRPRQVLVVADIINAKPDDNPHIWYIPTTMGQYAQALTTALIKQDPAHEAAYQQRLNTFMAKQAAFIVQVSQLRQHVTGLPVTATEPVFNWMAQALGLEVRNLPFQWSVENEGSPAPAAVQAMVDDLTKHQVRVLLYNNQVTSPLVDQMKSTAEEHQVPVVGVSETQPPGMSYHQWMGAQLQALAKALNQ
jgi:zinc/manganese transport system substrate-binding protein